MVRQFTPQRRSKFVALFNIQQQAEALQGSQPSASGGNNDNSDEEVNDAAQGLTDLHSGSPE